MIVGAVRTTLGTPATHDAVASRIPSTGDPAGLYAANVQIAELNALNAALAVMAWKRMAGFYAIQGPPGTGKSQTIANIVASAVADGKTVLFVAEKMAALEVVKRRLDATGVGDACLELHSNKANKKALLEELRRTWELGAPRHQDSGSLHARLTAARDRLNDHARRMHAPHGASGLTPFQVIGQLSRLRLDGEKPNDIVLTGPDTWSADDFAEQHDVIRDLAERIDVIGRPADHAWRGVGLSSILPTDVERLENRIAALLARLSSFDEARASLASTLETSPPTSFAELPPLTTLAERVAGAPDLDAGALAGAVWTDRMDDFERLIATGQRHCFLRGLLADVVAEAGWTADLAETIAALAILPSGFSPDDFRDVETLAGLLPRLQAEAEALARAMTRDAPNTIEGARRVAAVAERVAEAPEGDAAAFASEAWISGLERASDLVEVVATHEAASATVEGRLTVATWDTAEAGTHSSRRSGSARKKPVAFNAPTSISTATIATAPITATMTGPPQNAALDLAGTRRVASATTAA